VASNLDSLPKFGPGKFHQAAVVGRQVHAEASIKDNVCYYTEQLTTTQAIQTADTAVSSADTSSADLQTVHSRVTNTQSKLISFSD
jgi:flagellin-like hook-associated protein FlgL